MNWDWTTAAKRQAALKHKAARMRARNRALALERAREQERRELDQAATRQREAQRIERETHTFLLARERAAHIPAGLCSLDVLREDGIRIANHAKGVAACHYRYVVILFPDWGDADGSVLITNACGKELKPVLHAWSQKDSFMSYERTQRWSPDEVEARPPEPSGDRPESISIEMGFCD